MTTSSDSEKHMDDKVISYHKRQKQIENERAYIRDLAKNTKTVEIVDLKKFRELLKLQSGPGIEKVLCDHPLANMLGIMVVYYVHPHTHCRYYLPVEEADHEVSNWRN